MVLAYYGYGYGYDPTWILLVITGIIAVVAQIRVSSSFAKYSKVESRTGLTGAEAAERILHSKGIYDVRIHSILPEVLPIITILWIRHLICRMLLIIHVRWQRLVLLRMSAGMRYSMMKATHS